MQFPDKYEWLSEIGTLPKIVQEALKLHGTVEVPGKKSNPKILAWAKEVDLEDVYSDDDIPWCGLFMAVVVSRSGREPVDKPLWARNWAKFGVHADYASLGDILVFSRNGGGHVGIYICEDDDRYYVLGGNQSNAVTIAPIKKERCVAVVRPVYKNRPASSRPFFRSIGGKVSTNEA